MRRNGKFMMVIGGMLVLASLLTFGLTSATSSFGQELDTGNSTDVGNVDDAGAEPPASLPDALPDAGSGTFGSENGLLLASMLAAGGVLLAGTGYAAVRAQKRNG